MLAAGIETPVPIEELENHLRDDVEQQMRARTDAQQAFESAVRRIGQARLLKAEFRKAERAGGNNMINHNRLYTVVLGIMAIGTAVTAVGLYEWQRTVGGPVGHLPGRAVPWISAMNSAYTVIMAITLFARLHRAESSRRLTRILNWLLLPAFFCGTFLGLYGLWKVDKETPQHV